MLSNFMLCLNNRTSSRLFYNVGMVLLITVSIRNIVCIAVSWVSIVV